MPPKFPLQIVHFCNLYCPFQYPEKLVPDATVQLMAGHAIGLFGDGQQVREWLHVADACDAVLRTLERGELGESYIIRKRREINELPNSSDDCRTRGSWWELHQIHRWSAWTWYSICSFVKKSAKRVGMDPGLLPATGAKWGSCLVPESR